MKEKGQAGENDDEEESQLTESNLPVDKGYAWVVVFAASMILFLVIGSLKSFGVLYVELSREHNASNKELQSIQSLTGFFYLGLGPVGTALSMKFSHRAVCFVGGLFGGTGFLLTAFAPSLEYYYLTYGCLTGIGYGFSFSPCVVSFVHYFHKRRALANGIVTAGGGLGAVVLPYFMRYLIDVMSLKGCMMIFAGILYNICVFACLLRPHNNYPIKKRNGKKVSQKMTPSVDQQSMILLDASDLIHCDDKSYISVDDGRSQNSYVSEGEYLLRHAQKKSKRGNKMANASIVSLKSFNPSLYTNPENMTRSLCSEDQLSLDISSKQEKQMTASVISLKSFDPSLCSNPEVLGKSLYSENDDAIEVLKDDNQINASVISLKSFDPSVCSNIDVMGKSIYSDDQQSIGVASLSETSRKQSLGVVSLDSTSRESASKSKSVTESQTDEVEDERKFRINEHDQDKMNIFEYKENEKFSLENQKPVTKSRSQGKRRHLSAGNTSLKAILTNDKYKIDEENQIKNLSDECNSQNSLKAEKESLLKKMIWLKKDDKQRLTASVISLKSYDPSLCASLGVVASISMQSIPQTFERLDNSNRGILIESQTLDKKGHCWSYKKLCIFDWSLFKNPVFLLYLIFVFCESLGYLSIFNILPPFCEEIGGTDTQGAMIIAIISISELFGRLFFGWCTHMCPNNCKTIYFGATFLMGLGIVFTPDMSTFLHLAIFVGIYGFFSGGYNGVLFNTIINSLGLEKFSHAFGFIAFSASLSLLINPVESGLIKDSTGSWMNVFRVNGSVALFGCFMLLIITFLERRKPLQTSEIEMDTTVEL
ncbi:uncharacterized protein LOC127737976 [Mytilus californianus]|uniref:uncharacterized protein LOC127737976 n=1 Tax=Mytilus californianus TaxID=6549 RepID=UPI002246F1EE|nr:uncharacterized protein LOC127737976 [Mytilus californianus]XP_052104905.1 uncharacterized protein LOC127737976 [Mytilus californianus]XP_052104906.1 uncharacterized protein LOC127737976 [Mytilus californianus]